MPRLPLRVDPPHLIMCYHQDTQNLNLQKIPLPSKRQRKAKRRRREKIRRKQRRGNLRIKKKKKKKMKRRSMIFLPWEKVARMTMKKTMMMCWMAWILYFNSVGTSWKNDQLVARRLGVGQSNGPLGMTQRNMRTGFGSVYVQAHIVPFYAALV